MRKTDDNLTEYKYMIRNWYKSREQVIMLEWKRGEHVVSLIFEVLAKSEKHHEVKKVRN